MFEKRTNALNHPGTDLRVGKVYLPGLDSFVSYDARLYHGPRQEGKAHPGEPFFYALHNPYDMGADRFRPPEMPQSRCRGRKT